MRRQDSSVSFSWDHSKAKSNTCFIKGEVSCTNSMLHEATRFISKFRNLRAFIQTNLKKKLSILEQV